MTGLPDWLKSSRCDGGRIDLLRGTLRVAETCYKGHFGSPKTRASRREKFHWLPRFVRELKNNLFAFSRTLSKCIGISLKNQSLPLAADNLRKKGTTKPRAREAGLQRIDWHTLRHTHGTLLHSQGETPLKVAQAQLGHLHSDCTPRMRQFSMGTLAMASEVARFPEPVCWHLGR